MRISLVWASSAIATLLLGIGSDSRAQGVPEHLLTAADSLYFVDGDPALALEVLGPVISQIGEAPASTSAHAELLYEALWRAARASATLGLFSERRRAHEEWYDRAEVYARRAAELDPARTEGPYWIIVSQGRRALRAGALKASSLAEAVRRGAHEILARDPSHAGAHDALGRLYLEVLTLPRIHRILARLLAGRAAVAEATWEAAESHLRQAVELAPDVVIYRVDLARLHVAQQDWAAASEDLEAAQSLPIVTPADTVFQREASRLARRVP